MISSLNMSKRVSNRSNKMQDYNLYFLYASSIFFTYTSNSSVEYILHNNLCVRKLLISLFITKCIIFVTFDFSALAERHANKEKHFPNILTDMEIRVAALVWMVIFAFHFHWQTVINHDNLNVTWVWRRLVVGPGISVPPHCFIYNGMLGIHFTFITPAVSKLPFTIIQFWYIFIKLWSPTVDSLLCW